MNDRPAAPEPQKRFYREATLGHGDLASILLDGRQVRTPRRALLVAPRPVAAVVAAEWNAQGDVILPLTMPMTRLANTAIDGVAASAEAVAGDIAAMAQNDLVIYRADGPAGLVAAQGRHWDGVVRDTEAALGVPITLAEGVMPVRQDPRLAAAVRAVLPAEPLSLAAMHQLTTLMGSAFIALAFARGALTFDAAWAAAHVDEDWNIRQWGEDAEAAQRRAARRRDAEAAAFVLSGQPGTGE